MKGTTLYGLVSCLFAMGTLTPVLAQEVKTPEKKEIKVVKRTVMEQYEPGMILTADDRTRLKKERIALIQKRRRIIDTLDISERRKRSLLKELYRSPHTDKWDRLIADLEFEDDEDF
ncbi:MAG: hypothetical protein KJN76_07990 [Eudoraea sp.]|nr:hypothetical protein [Eudoraea sp.]